MRLFRRSLRRRMASGFLAAYAIVMASALMLIWPLMTLDDDHLFGADVAGYAATDGVYRAADGSVAFRPPRALLTLRAKAPQLWVLVRVADRRFAYGAIPAVARAAIAQLPADIEVASLHLGAQRDPRSAMQVNRVETAFGAATIYSGGVANTAIGWRDHVSWAFNSQLYLLIPGVVALGLIAVAIVVPWVLRALRPIAREAEAVGPDHLERRIDERGVAFELLPVVRGFNMALDRLADAFGRQRRFVADVAHELRTPVAVLGAQIDLLDDTPARRELQRGVTRLSVMIGQMLDAERLVLADRHREPTDLVALVRRATGDIAPLAVPAGYRIGFEAESPVVIADVDPHAIERAVANLLGNAVAHGGNRGSITARVRSDGAIQIEDEGAGVPVEARDRIFEPFRRERWDRDGCGLGLYLVRQIALAHDGTLTVATGDAGGARFQLMLPTVRHPLVT